MWSMIMVRGNEVHWDGVMDDQLNIRLDSEWNTLFV